MISNQTHSQSNKSTGTLQALHAMTSEKMFDELDQFDPSNNIVCCSTLTKACKQDFEYVRNKFLFAQAQTIIKTSEATQFSKQMRQTFMTLKSPLPAANVL